ncbi:Uncharacterised protein [Mycobacteroides abscessus subsp. massiliense]|nr:Uncharacterised protein [Mycobacteroides abscessus subsp. massiliense]SKT45879.1 Uncharacterised protein [Mycobacteroides abscessus subsp. massiliense]
MSHQCDVVTELAEDERVVECQGSGAQYGDGAVAYFPAVAVHAVEHVAAPAFGQSLDIGQLVHHAGGNQDPPRAQHRPAIEGDVEMVVGVGYRGGASVEKGCAVLRCLVTSDVEQLGG